MAAWWPVDMTSDSARILTSVASSKPDGSGTSVPSANGTRTASPCPPSDPAWPQKPPAMQLVCSPSWQNTQLPSDHTNGATTGSPTRTDRTLVPTASTTPRYS
jgi:hypothetical protein